MKVALYVRKSQVDLEAERKAAERGENYDTLKRHRNELLRLAKDNNYIIVDIFEEVASGDTIKARPEIQKMLINIRNYDYDAVLVIEYDRLGRGNKKDQGTIEEALKDTDTLIITPHETIDLNSEQGEFTADTKSFISRMELRIIKKRLKEGKKRSITEGKDVSNKQPYGFDKDPVTKKLVHNDYAPFAKLIFELYDELETLHRVVEELYRIGIPTKEGKDRWDYQTIKRMLKNKKYIGTMFYNTNNKRDYTEQPDAHEPIIDIELFNRVNKKLLNVNDHKTNKKYELQNPFASIGTCKICNSRTKLHNLKYKYIRCSNYHCSNKFIRFEDYEEKFLSKLKDILASIEIDTSKIKKNNNKITLLKEQLKNLYNEENKLNKREKKIYENYEDETYTKEMFKDRLDILNEDKNALKLKIESLKDIIEYEQSQNERINNIAPAIKNVLDVYNLSNPEQKNRLIKSFVKEIITHKPEKYKDFDMEVILKD